MKTHFLTAALTLGLFTGFNPMYAEDAKTETTAVVSAGTEAVATTKAAVETKKEEEKKGAEKTKGHAKKSGPKKDRAHSTTAMMADHLNKGEVIPMELAAKVKIGKKMHNQANKAVASVAKIEDGKKPGEETKEEEKTEEKKETEKK